MYPGIGLIELNGPLAGLPDTGDNLDALDIVEPIGPVAGGLFYSLTADGSTLPGLPELGLRSCTGSPRPMC